MSTSSSPAAAAATPTPSAATPASSLETWLRGDSAPYEETNPGFGTRKTRVDVDSGDLVPADEHGTVSPAEHIHGREPYKSRSQRTSFTDSPEVAARYGGARYLITVDPSRQRRVTRNREILSDIRGSTTPELQEEARNVTQPGRPLWQPPDPALAARLGLAGGAGGGYTLRQRALFNAANDREQQTEGRVVDPQLWKRGLINIDPSKIGAARLAKLKAKYGLAFDEGGPGRPGGIRYPVPRHAYRIDAARERAIREQQEVERERAEDEQYRRTGGALIPYRPQPSALALRPTASSTALAPSSASSSSGTPQIRADL